MAVDVNLTTVNSGYNTNIINNNFTAIKTALQDALSRSGGTPNTMSSDFDMNSNDILNAGVINSKSLVINGTPVSSEELALANFLPFTQVEMSRNSAKTTSFSQDLKAIQLGGYESIGDGGEGRWKRVDSEPSHEGKFRSLDRFISTGVTDDVNGGWWELSERFVTLQQFGGKPDAGVTDNTTALQNADNFGAESIFMTKGQFDILTDYRPVTPLIGIGGWITRVGSINTFYPKSSIDLSSLKRGESANHRASKIITDADMPADTGSYQQPRSFAQFEVRTIQTSGRRGIHTGGGSTGAAQVIYNNSHLGDGDCYSNFFEGSASRTNFTVSYLDWGWQQSAGMMGGQYNAQSDKVNLYGAGDIVLKDGGFQDVSLLGYVTFLDNSGGNTGDYEIPRLGHYIKSIGSNNIDAAFIAGGPMFVGYDATEGTFSSNTAYALATNQRVAWNASKVRTSGQFSTKDVGDTFTYHSSGQLIDIVGGTSIFARGTAFAKVQPGVDGFSTFRIAGASATAELHLGQAGTASTITAVSSGADNTSIQFRTASSGAEATRWTISAAGTLSPQNSTQNFGATSQRIANNYSIKTTMGTTGNVITTAGPGTPEGNVTADVGSIYGRTDGGAGTSLYVKESGSGNTGWIAK